MQESFKVSGQSPGVKNNSGELLTLEQISEVLQVPKKTIYYWVSRNEIPFLKIGKHLRFDRVKVLTHFEEKTEATKPKHPCIDSLKPLLSEPRKQEIKPVCSLKTRNGEPASSLKGVN